MRRSRTRCRLWYPHWSCTTPTSALYQCNILKIIMLDNNFLASIFTSMLLASWSDNNGRKPIMILPCIGGLLCQVVYILNVYFSVSVDVDGKNRKLFNCFVYSLLELSTCCSITCTHCLVGTPPSYWPCTHSWQRQHHSLAGPAG